MDTQVAPAVDASCTSRTIFSMASLGTQGTVIRTLDLQNAVFGLMVDGVSMKPHELDNLHYA